MTMEEAIRQRQQFRNILIKFVSFASHMTTDQIELGLARIADKMHSETIETEILHYKLKGSILKDYYDLRLANIARRKDVAELDYSVIEEYEHPLLREWRENCILVRRLWDGVRNQSKYNRKNLPESTPVSRLPKQPDISLEEKLLHVISEFRLLPKDVRPPENINVKDILHELG